MLRLNLKSNLQNHHTKPCKLFDNQVNDSYDNTLEKVPLGIGFVIFKTVATLKQRILTLCPCVVYGLNLLQLSKHEFQVWSQFVTQGIVKNIFQKNLGTEVTQMIIWVLSLQDSCILTCFLRHPGKL